MTSGHQRQEAHADGDVGASIRLAVPPWWKPPRLSSVRTDSPAAANARRAESPEQPVPVLSGQATLYAFITDIASQRVRSYVGGPDRELDPNRRSSNSSPTFARWLGRLL